MEQANQENNPNSSATVSGKKKRGRPRKYPYPDEKPKLARDGLNSGGNVHNPPRTGEVNGNMPGQLESNGILVGQAVQGMIEAAFEAGYFLSVKVGSTGKTLRGAVFKPGYFVPVRADNDVAPNIPMIPRSEIPLPPDNSNPRFQRNELHDHSKRNGKEKLATSKGHQAPPVTSHSTHLGGNFVPVARHPADLSNGRHKGKRVLKAHSLNESSPVNQVSAVGQMTMKSTGRPVERLLTEVMNNEAPAKSSHTSPDNSESGDLSTEDEGSNGNHALSVEPLQSVQPGQPIPAPISPPPANIGTGKMTELLQAMQDMKEN